ncbi:uncharacterized protein TRIADDRAFT_57715 [Trichoplax adhaerens]|uniref:Actin-interacting protein 1 n=1 Tax=Trichoplax adhaerens TaxID=10228 RepID=B3S078_TRIAD|nr:hypothetical protein TRIADDRAFT_57715 [Trichoplax adhaerens]EDV24340.1 hypothetical protein TRIADDRAFT_57715 [Trichoplax adhaerens]|eukprot:XP_002113866.1 hypothetical protein TRIADDRAFT_57715 [Trichoplax adhaerens]
MLTVGDEVYTVGIDDCMKKFSTASNEYSSYSLKLDSQPRALCSGGGNIIFVACMNEISITNEGQKENSLLVKYEPNSISFNSVTCELAVGSSKENFVYVYKVSGYNLEEITKVSVRGTPSHLAYSPNGELLAVGDSQRCLTVMATKAYSVTLHSWSYHTARVSYLAWSPDSTYIASGGIDSNVILWSVADAGKKAIVKGAHPMSPVNGIVWLDNSSFVSVGSDCCTRLWDI